MVLRLKRSKTVFLKQQIELIILIMKKVTSIFAFIFCVSVLFAQTPQVVKSGDLVLVVGQEMRTMSAGNENALTVVLPKTNKKVVEKAWEKYIKKNFKAKAKRDKKSGEMFADNATIKGVSDNTVDVYAKVTEMGGDTELSVWYNLGGAYLSSANHPQRYPAAEKMVLDFSASVSKALVEEELKMEKGKVKGLQKELKGFEKDQKKAEDEIAKAEKKIKEMREKIEKAKENQEMKKKEIGAQEAVIKSVEKRLKEF